MAEVTELSHRPHSAENNASSSSSSSVSAAGKKHHHHHHHHHHDNNQPANRHQTVGSMSSAVDGDSVPITVERTTPNAAAAATMCSNSADTPPMVQVPLVRDTMTFDGRQASRLREIERRIETEMKRKKREWQREVDRMREEFLELYPADRVWGSEEMLSDPLVKERCGSTDKLDAKKMRTLFMDYPDSGRRYKIRFNVANCDPKSVRVSTDGDRIVVRAMKYFTSKENAAASSNDLTPSAGYECCRKIQKPKDVDHTKFKAYLTADSVLVVEAPVPPSLNLRKTIQSPSHSHCGSTHSRSPSGSPAAGVGPDTPSKEKIGVPIFRDENGRRRLHLVIDLGNTFQPTDITVQVIKDNKIQVRAKHEEKTVERLCKSKFSKEYELGEKIETLSLTGGLSADGRLYVGAYTKGQPDPPAKASGTTTDDTSAPTASATDENAADSASLKPCNVLAANSASSSSTALPTAAAASS